ncbi:pyridoxamine 5'-phosphate oxidase family protein [Nonomuraea basaltis]|uniref:pyridoxamine 5'-phosphate oxidase family protein n=1 Tax=Nonomuraea basaltis TaxID=2495887 RepID=UPI00110C4B2E|nr:pyridoxamine 5'-phosphate oxidase family protein [Nonomuraea basaltis]TMR96841.1 pyridoxamine 5'-phosphate oxidase family protein [Nonomuraea basaltis]
MQRPSTPSAPIGKELSRGEGLRLLSNVTFGRIVFISHAVPAIRLVSHTMDGDGLMVGLPHDSEIASLLQRVHRVVYQADLLDAATRLGWSVVLTGRAGLVEDPQEQSRARDRLQPWPGQAVDHIARIFPEWVTGFSITAPHTGATR